MQPHSCRKWNNTWRLNGSTIYHLRFASCMIMVHLLNNEIFHKAIVIRVQEEPGSRHCKHFWNDKSNKVSEKNEKEEVAKVRKPFHQHIYAALNKCDSSNQCKAMLWNALHYITLPVKGRWLSKTDNIAKQKDQLQVKDHSYFKTVQLTEVTEVMDNRRQRQWNRQTNNCYHNLFSKTYPQHCDQLRKSKRDRSKFRRQGELMQNSQAHASLDIHLKDSLGHQHLRCWSNR